MKINSMQASSLIIPLMLSCFFGINTVTILNISKNSSIISLIIGLSITFLFFRIILYINKYKNNMTIQDLLINLFGKKAGNKLNRLLLISIFILSIITFHNLINFLNINFIRNTPIIITSILFIYLFYMINKKGIETISRTSLILVSLSILTFIIIIIGLIPHYNIASLKPVILSYNTILKSPTFITTSLIPYLFTILSINTSNLIDKNKYLKYSLATYMITSIMILIFTTSILSVLEKNLSTMYNYPEYQTLSIIKYFNIFNRCENILVLPFIISFFISISFQINYLLKNINYKNSNTKLLTISSLLLITSLLITKDKIYNNIINITMPIISTIILFIILFILIKIFQKKRC